MTKDRPVPRKLGILIRSLGETRFRPSRAESIGDDAMIVMNARFIQKCSGATSAYFDIAIAASEIINIARMEICSRFPVYSLI